MTPTSKEVINALCKILDATPKKINLFMTPKEKAKEIVENFENALTIKDCALIAVDEMLSNDGWSSSRDEWDRFKKYCEELKLEIRKL